MADDKENLFDEEQVDIDQLIEWEKAERQKRYLKRKMTNDLSLKTAWSKMTKVELEDIGYNVNLKGISKLRKEQLIEKLYPAVLEFLPNWLPSILEEQYNGLVKNLKKGVVTEWDNEDMRLDYLKAIGVLACGSQADKIVWYMPTDIQFEFKKVNSAVYRKLASLNTKVATLATGCLFYYGYMDFDALYEKVIGYLEPAEKEQVSLSDFIHVMLNAACWDELVDVTEYGAKYYAVMEEDKIYDEQLKRPNVDYAKFSYDELYAAGQSNYWFDDTDVCRDLAIYLIEQGDLSPEEATRIMIDVVILVKNDGPNEALKYLFSLEDIANKFDMDKVTELMMNFNNNTRLWEIKGHMPSELFKAFRPAAMMGQVIPFDQVARQKVGRNEPCPCGSGKKYKNCCLRKDEN